MRKMNEKVDRGSEGRGGRRRIRMCNRKVYKRGVSEVEKTPNQEDKQLTK